MTAAEHVFSIVGHAPDICRCNQAYTQTQLLLPSTKGERSAVQRCRRMGILMTSIYGMERKMSKNARKCVAFLTIRIMCQGSDFDLQGPTKKSKSTCTVVKERGQVQRCRLHESTFVCRDRSAAHLLGGRDCWWAVAWQRASSLCHVCAWAPFGAGLKV